MSRALRHVLISAGILALALLSHGPLLRAGWLGGDLEILSTAHRPVTGSLETHDAGRFGWLDGGRIRPVPGNVLIAHDRALGGDGVFAAVHAPTLRAIAFLVLLCAAVASGFALRRALEPWVGRDTARAAGFALALFVSTHPLGTAALARPAALGDLFALAFGGLSAFLFLRGRQEREKHWVVFAGLAAMAAGFSSPTAVILPFVLAGLEFGSARRPRPLSERARTAATTCVVFLGAVLFEGIVALALPLPARTGFAGALPDLPSWSEVPLGLATCVEKLGILFLPVPGRAQGRTWPDYIVCIALVMIALWPVLRSARVAPRLWGWLAIAWLAAIAISLWPEATSRVAPADDSKSELLVTAMVFACTGLAVAATSLLGTRRIVLPAIIAIGLSWLGAQSASNFIAASRVVAELRTEVIAAQAKGGEQARVLVIDPPASHRGLPLHFESVCLQLDRAEITAYVPLAVSADALPMLSRTPEFEDWRRRGLVLLEVRQPRSPEAAGATRVIPPAAGTPPPVRWREKGQSALFDVDPSRTHFARFQALPGTSTAEAPRMLWRASEPDREWFTATGVWLEGANAPIAVFDLADEFPWWSAPTIRRVWTEGPLVNVDSAELVEEIPLAIDGGKFHDDGRDWRFEIPANSLERPLRGDARFVLQVLDVESHEHESLACTVEQSESTCTVTARGARPTAPGCELSTHSSAVRWSLERRVGDVVIARSSGRL